MDRRICTSATACFDSNGCSQHRACRRSEQLLLSGRRFWRAGSASGHALQPRPQQAVLLRGLRVHGPATGRLPAAYFVPTAQMMAGTSARLIWPPWGRPSPTAAAKTPRTLNPALFPTGQIPAIPAGSELGGILEAVPQPNINPVTNRSAPITKFDGTRRRIAGNSGCAATTTSATTPSCSSPGIARSSTIRTPSASGGLGQRLCPIRPLRMPTRFPTFTART